ncbi:hypothetical protein GF314_04130 [bacterium]|nr:hypothetical protein [bacterium]
MQNEQNDQQQPMTPPPAVNPPPSGGVRDRRDMPYKLPWLAGFLSGIFPGIGQVYVGYYRQGIVLGLIFITIITVLASGDIDDLEPMFGMALGFVWIYNIIDAARRAQIVNRMLDGYGPDALPEDVPLPGAGGSRAGGWILIALGVLIFANLNFGLSLEWLENVWPLGLIALGGWLVWKAREDGSTGRSESTGTIDGD